MEKNNMPDITMCVNNNCERKNECYRAMAESNNYQSYSDFAQICNKQNNFSEFIPVKHLSDA